MENGAPVTRPLMVGSTEPLPQQNGSTYSVPGVLHFIKHEFGRFERERANWEVERAELQAKIAFLQGERKGHENLMRDLIRRIKMLEYVLKQERAKLYKLQHGTEVKFNETKTPENEIVGKQSLEAPSLGQQRESRRILREYLKEVGFPDNVLEARVARLNMYHALVSENEQKQSKGESEVSVGAVKYSNTPSEATGPIPNGTDTIQQSPSPPPTGSGDTTEAIVTETFNFLDEEDESDDEDEPFDTKEFLRGLETSNDVDESISRDLDLGSESAMKEFVAFDVEQKQGDQDKTSSDKSAEDWNKQSAIKQYQDDAKSRKSANISSRPTKAKMQGMERLVNEMSETSSSSSAASSMGGFGMLSMPGKGRMKGLKPDVLPDESIEAASLGLTELQNISIANERDSATGYSNTPATEVFRKWEHKYTMRSHFDVVTCVAFHPTEAILLSGSQDCTLKMSNLQKSAQNRRAAIIDVEPMYTFRGHTGPVLSIALSTDGDVLYSGSTDGSIRLWQIPSDMADPYDVYDPEVQRGVLHGHKDAIWGLCVHTASGLLASCAADGTVKLWDAQLTEPLVRTIQPEESFGSPTSLDYVHNDLHHLAVSYTTSRCVLYDIETGQQVVTLDSAVTYDGTPNTQINKLVSHPTLPIILTAHEDKYIRFFDSKSGEVVHSMTAHMDAVTGLSVDPHGLYVLSGSHDGSLRFWSMDTKTCVQEITAHRKHFDEAVFNVTCHLSQPYFASAGADGIVKVFD